MRTKEGLIGKNLTPSIFNDEKREISNIKVEENKLILELLPIIGVTKKEFKKCSLVLNSTEVEALLEDSQVIIDGVQWSLVK